MTSLQPQPLRNEQPPPRIRNAPPSGGGDWASVWGRKLTRSHPVVTSARSRWPEPCRSPGGRSVGMGRMPAAGTQTPDRPDPRPLRGEMPLQCASALGRTCRGQSRVWDSGEAGDAPCAVPPHLAPAGSPHPHRSQAASPPARALKGPSVRRLATPVCRCTHTEPRCSADEAPGRACARSEPHQVPLPALPWAALPSAAGRRSQTQLHPIATLQSPTSHTPAPHSGSRTPPRRGIAVGPIESSPL